jgi:hypothetical protein
MRAIDRWRRLDDRQRRVAIRAGIALGTAIAVLNIAGLRRALRWAEIIVATPHERERTITELIAGVDRAGRYLPGATCLSKSLALVRMLRAEGVPADMRVGVAGVSPFEAHAWVECEGIELTASKGMDALVR